MICEYSIFAEEEAKKKAEEEAARKAAEEEAKKKAEEEAAKNPVKTIPITFTGSFTHTGFTGAVNGGSWTSTFKGTMTIDTTKSPQFQSMNFPNPQTNANGCSFDKNKDAKIINLQYQIRSVILDAAVYSGSRGVLIKQYEQQGMSTGNSNYVYKDFVNFNSDVLPLFQPYL